jgi:hypothetical protein
VELENLLDRAAETQRKPPPSNQSGVACPIQPHRPPTRLPQQPPHPAKGGSDDGAPACARSRLPLAAAEFVVALFGVFLAAARPRDGHGKQTLWAPQKELPAVSLAAQPCTIRAACTASSFTNASAWSILASSYTTDIRVRRRNR